MHTTIQSACKSSVNLNHVVVSAARPCELPSRGEGRTVRIQGLF